MWFSELPQKKCLKYLCGVEVEVSFSALFSNVMVVFASVKSTAHQTQDCTVTLSSIPVRIMSVHKTVFLSTYQDLEQVL